jgi:hypothetical protein
MSITGIASRFARRRLRGERCLNCRSIISKPWPVFIRKRELATHLAELNLDRQQVCEQDRTKRLGRVSHRILDPQRRAGLPRGLELVALGDDLIELFAA